MIQIKLTGALLMVCAVLSAQGPQDQPVYRVTVTSRTAKAISYQHRSGATKINFAGTELLPGSRGEAKVESQPGPHRHRSGIRGLQPATKNGAEYLTYVLWAVTPEGRTANLGEVLLNGTKSKLDVTTELQVFGLIVTAEPYYAVSQPSDLVVMENMVRADTAGKIESIDAKYELLQRGQYQRLANPLALKMDRKQPLELYEARNAVQIARSIGADKFAPETFQKAEKSLAQAEAYQTRNAGRKAGSHDFPRGRPDGGRFASHRCETPGGRGIKHGTPAFFGARSERGERARSRAVRDRSRQARCGSRSGSSAQADTERLTREKMRRHPPPRLKPIA